MEISSFLNDVVIIILVAFHHLVWITWFGQIDRESGWGLLVT
jgi:hypothetical protein